MGWRERLFGWAEESLGISPELFVRLLTTVLVIVAYVLLHRAIMGLWVRRVVDPSSRYGLSKVVGYGLGFLSLAVLARVWMQGITGLATYLGLLSAGIAVALQDPLINLAGWLFIVVRRPFEVGDRIQIGAHAGDVVDVRLFQFVLLEIGNWVDADQSTGRVIHLPNGMVFKNPQANYDKPFQYIWHEIAVVVTFESNWRKAKEVLSRAVNDHAEHLTADATKQIDVAAERYHIKFSKLTPVVWTSVVDHGVRLTLRYLCRPRERRSSEHEMWEAILTEFEQLPDVDFAYPTTRRFDNRYEGKSQARVGEGGDRPSHVG